MGRSQVTAEAAMEGALQLKRYSNQQQWLLPSVPEKTPQTPSEWFGQKFPHQLERFGPPVLESVLLGADGTKKITPVSINEEFFAAVVGGVQRLKHQVVYFQPEQIFYFFDPRDGFYAPTSEEKLKILLSQLFLKCAEAMPRAVDIDPIFNEFRSEETLKRILKRARALLAADASFFCPESTNNRAKGPEIHERLARLFIKQTIQPEPQKILTVAQCFELFCCFCKASGFEPVARRHFRPMLTELIREEFDLGLRKDLLDANQKYQNGWKGLAARPSLSLSGLNRN